VQVCRQYRLLIKGEGPAARVQAEHHRLGLELTPVPHRRQNALFLPAPQRGETLEPVHQLVASGPGRDDGDRLLQVQRHAPSGRRPLEVKESGANPGDGYLNYLHQARLARTGFSGSERTW